MLLTQAMHHPIPFHYAERVHQQLQDMVQEGTVSYTPALVSGVPHAVYMPKSSGEIRICVDYVQLNGVTKKDSHPVLRPKALNRSWLIRIFFET